MGTFWQDVKYGVRMLMKAPGFTAVAVLSLTLGIGANTTIFTMAKAVFLQSVPVKDPATLMALFSTAQSNNGPVQQFLPTPYLNALDYREKTNVFSGLAITVGMGTNLVVSGKKVNVFALLVNANFLNVLGVQPALGRDFTAEEDSTPTPVAIISYALWKGQFASDPNILGHPIHLDQQAYNVVGILPQDFHDVANIGSPDVLLPMSMHDVALTGSIVKTWFIQRAFRLAGVYARLKPGVTPAVAGQAVHTLGLELEKEYPKDNRGRNEQVLPITDTTIPPQLRGIVVLAGQVMMLIVGLVLLIACANVANLLLARATQRQREIAVRLAMGASRTRLIRQLLTESLILAFLAAVLGIFAAYWGRSLLVSLLPGGFPQLDFSIDGKVLLYTIGLALMATVLFGLLPAWQASRADTVTSLKDRTGAPTGSARWYGLRGILVMVQVALSLIALVGAGLFIHSLRNAQQIDPGFEVKHEMVMFVNLGAEHYPQAQAEQFYRDAVERMKGLPMIADASMSDTPPLSGSLARTTFTDGVDATDPRNGKLTPVVAVAPGYFQTAGVALLRGRDFTDADNAQSQMVAVVNRAFADVMYPSQEVLGKHIHFLGEPWDIAIIGEVNTVKYNSLGEPAQPVAYLALKQQYSPAVTFFIRTKNDPASAMATVRSTMKDLAPNLPLLRMQTVEQRIVNSLVFPRVAAELLGTFGFLALILAAIGTYGVMSYSVNQRTQEIGIRMALGAQPGDVVRLILSSGMAMVVAGVVVGLGISVLFARSLGSLLFGIGSFDAASFLSTAALLILVALAACWIPARRAMRVDPIVALRYE
ncbi:MAG TPA: ABC transporter permease [Candidatus Acidoferrales bacterium]|nr:ABC transporter permease [Candidatus Acidoferrales bacterium]